MQVRTISGPGNWILFLARADQQTGCNIFQAFESFVHSVGQPCPDIWRQINTSTLVCVSVAGLRVLLVTQPTKYLQRPWLNTSTNACEPCGNKDCLLLGGSLPTQPSWVQFSAFPIFSNLKLLRLLDSGTAKRECTVQKLNS